MRSVTKTVTHIFKAQTCFVFDFWYVVWRVNFLDRCCAHDRSINENESHSEDKRRVFNNSWRRVYNVFTFFDIITTTFIIYLLIRCVSRQSLMSNCFRFRVEVSVEEEEDLEEEGGGENSSDWLQLDGDLSVGAAQMLCYLS